MADEILRQKVEHWVAALRDNDEILATQVSLMNDIIANLSDIPDPGAFVDVLVPLESFARRNQTWNAAARRFCAVVRRLTDANGST